MKSFSIRSLSSLIFPRDRLINQLEKLLGSKNVLCDPTDCEPFNTDWKGVHKTETSSGYDYSIVVTPRERSEVVGLMKFCHENKIAVCPQGGNTGLVGGSVPISSDEVIVSFSKMNKIDCVDEESGVVSSQSGCILADLDNRLHSVGLCAPLDLAAKGSCQIGGNVATNAGGVRLIRLGSLRENVLGMRVVLADGSELKLDKTVRKDNTGLSLKQLFIGSEGTLGLITDLNILCPTKSTSRSVMLIALDTFDDLVRSLRLARSSLTGSLSAFELIDRDALSVTQRHFGYELPFELKEKFFALLEVSGNGSESELVDSFLSELYDSGLAKNGVSAHDEKQCDQIWALRENITEALIKTGPNYKFDISLPLSKYYGIVEYIRHKWASQVKHIVAYGHVADGNVHLNIVDHEWNEEKRLLISEDIYQYTIENNGSISAEHGIGREKVKYLNRIHSSEVLKQMTAIKHMFDPYNLLNRGKFYPS